MDDVLIVVGLLLFGSSLFCLCCYKVSNLLYMLYHIDDVESVAGDISTAAITTATAALAVVAPSNTAAATAACWAAALGWRRMRAPPLGTLAQWHA